jgi:2-dehydro-3-deoxy-D-arabinonate dehydratase
MGLNEFITSMIEGQDSLSYDLSWVEPRFIMPMVPSEVWAAGVTYKRSVEAREDETDVKGIYDRVYESERPEILIKGLGYRTVGLERRKSWHI